MRTRLVIIVLSTFISGVSIAQSSYLQFVEKAEKATQDNRHLQAAVLYEKAIGSCDDCSASVRAELYTLKGRSLQLSERYNKAYESYKKACSLADVTEDKNAKVFAYVNLADFCRNRARFKRARNLMYQASNWIDKEKISLKNQAYYYSRYAAVLSENNSGADSVLMMSNIALEIARKIEDKNLEATSLNEVAFIHENRGDLLVAIEGYKSAIKLWSELNMNRDAANACSNISRTFFNLKRLNEALHYADKGIKLCGKNNWSSILKDLFYHKSEVLIAQGRQSEARLAQKSFYDHTLKLKEKEWNKEMAKVSAELDLQIKDKEIISAKKNQELVQHQLKDEKERKSSLIFWLITIGLSLIVITFLAAREIHANRRLKKTLASKLLLLKEVHHRVKNNMQMVSSVLELQKSFIRDTKAREAIERGQDRIQSLALAHQNLYTSENFDSIKLKEYIENVARSVCPKDVQWSLELEEKQFDIEKAQAIGFIINELIMNSAQHAWGKNAKDKRIKIRFAKNATGWSFSYQDNGKGVANKEEFSNSATFGMTLVKSFLKRNLKAKMEFGEEEGMHLIFVINYF